MWKHVAIVRSVHSLNKASAKLNEIWDQFQSMQSFNSIEYFELRNMIIVSKIVIQSALKRKESRGLHFMSDFPETDSNFQNDTIIQKEV